LTLQELSDFAVEIDILHELSHKNVVQLYDAYFHNNKLWVSGGDSRRRLGKGLRV
jgi:hypothetical protein